MINLVIIICFFLEMSRGKLKNNSQELVINAKFPIDIWEIFIYNKNVHVNISNFT